MLSHLRIALLPCVSDNAQGYFFFPSKPPCSWFLGPLSQLKLVYIPLSVLSLPFPSLAREFQYLRHVPWFYIFLLYQLPPSPLVQPMHSSPYPRPTISIIILFTKLFSCFLGVLVVTVLWFFPPRCPSGIWLAAFSLPLSQPCMLLVVTVSSSLLPFLSSSAYTYLPLLRLSRLNRSLFTRTANHRDFPCE
ncbi:hypothetical protein EDB84DRAFT_232331 [Lactarius hengduanensis]|nr:hypothetical protein EDB84DRAFT_232331 [Lactarius hengduanensis]